MYKSLPPCCEYKLPPKNPFIGAQAAYTKIVALRMEPRLQETQDIHNYLKIKTDFVLINLHNFVTCTLYKLF